MRIQSRLKVPWNWVPRRRSGTLLSLLALGLLLYCAGQKLALSSKTVASSSPKNRTTTGAPENSQATSPKAQLVRRSQLWPQLRDILNMLGDRFEKSGKERLTMVGTLSRLSGSQTQTTAFRLITEFPGRMRLDEQAGTQTRIIAFNGQDARRVGGSVSRSDEDTIETLVFDSVDHFFDGQMGGVPTRFLGYRFRLDDGTTTNYVGPFYDIYQIADQVRIGPSVRTQPKLCYFNSKSLLLEEVHYSISRDGVPIDVEIQIRDWSTLNDQRFPAYIARIENGQPVLTLTITSAVLGPQVDDAIF